VPPIADGKLLLSVLWISLPKLTEPPTRLLCVSVLLLTWSSEMKEGSSLARSPLVEELLDFEIDRYTLLLFTIFFFSFASVFCGYSMSISILSTWESDL
jgi:hypothetical protein